MNMFDDGVKAIQLVQGSKGNWVWGWVDSHIVSEFMPKRQALSAAIKAWTRRLKRLARKEAV